MVPGVDCDQLTHSSLDTVTQQLQPTVEVVGLYVRQKAGVLWQHGVTVIMVPPGLQLHYQLSQLGSRCSELAIEQCEG